MNAPRTLLPRTLRGAPCEVLLTTLLHHSVARSRSIERAMCEVLRDAMRR